jgi:hypothetical protein
MLQNSDIDNWARQQADRMLVRFSSKSKEFWNGVVSVCAIDHNIDADPVRRRQFVQSFLGEVFSR